MAVKAVCAITHLTQNSSDPTTFNVTVEYVALVSPTFGGTTTVSGVNASGSGATIDSQIENGVQAFLIGSGSLAFGPSDSVLLLPR